MWKNSECFRLGARHSGLLIQTITVGECIHKMQDGEFLFIYLVQTQTERVATMVKSLQLVATRQWKIDRGRKFHIGRMARKRLHHLHSSRRHPLCCSWSGEPTLVFGSVGVELSKTHRMYDSNLEIREWQCQSGALSSIKKKLHPSVDRMMQVETVQVEKNRYQSFPLPHLTNGLAYHLGPIACNQKHKEST